VSELADLVARLPWVTRLGQAQPCDGYRWNHMRGKALRDPAIMTEYKCRNRARWQFRPLPGSWLREGAYCWPHLQTQLHSMSEEARTRSGLAALRQETESAGDRT
jgi:hypothetical protein